MKYVKPERIFLKDNPELNEKWVQERIAEDPSILGLGELVLKDKERQQPKAGRLDLLLQDSESDRRYEVEIQLGETDESHIIRTIEYWDLERKRYPQYDHAAVLVAEDITSRFLNVVNLFNGNIPLIAIQMSAFRVGDSVSLLFTTVLDELTRGMVEDDEDVHEVTDRGYWEQRATRDTVAMVDSFLDIIKILDPGLKFKYNKFYIGLAKNDQPNNFVIFKPQKNGTRMEIRLPRSSEMESRIEQAGLVLMDYDKRWGRYRIRLEKEDLKKHAEFLSELLKKSFEANR